MLGGIHMNEQYLKLGEHTFIRYSAIASIAAIAAFEVEGVTFHHGKLADELIDRLSLKMLRKTIDLSVDEVTQELSVTINAKVNYGFKIDAVSKKVQESVKEEVLIQTGVNLKAVNVNIIGIQLDN
jgi:uncharacterized alkaline shock family protein YloU